MLKGGVLGAEISVALRNQSRNTKLQRGWRNLEASSDESRPSGLFQEYIRREYTV